LGNLEDGSSTGDFERWMNGALGMERLSLRGSVEEASGWGGCPSLGTLEDMLKSPEAGISLHGGPFPAEGNLIYV